MHDSVQSASQWRSDGQQLTLRLGLPLREPAPQNLLDVPTRTEGTAALRLLCVSEGECGVKD